MHEEMVEKQVSVYPYARFPGTVMVPANIADDIEKAEEYVAEHFNDVKLGEPEFDFKGADFQVK